MIFCPSNVCMEKLIVTKEEYDRNVRLVNGVPKVMWCFWASGEMPPNRKRSFQLLCKHISCLVCLVSDKTFFDFEVDGAAIHSAYNQLSAVHKSDYVRAYLWHHYGGGWHDIKATLVSFDHVWAEFADGNTHLVGRPEIRGGAARTFDKERRWMPDFWQDLVSVTAWVGRPATSLSGEVYRSLQAYLDENLELLQSNPAKHPRDKCLGELSFLKKIKKNAARIMLGEKNSYPLTWTVFGNAFHPACLKYKENISRNLPMDELKNAGIYHR